MRRTAPMLLLAAAALSLPPAQEPSAAGRTVRFEAEPGGSLLVHGEYPRTDSSCVDPEQPLLHSRFRGAVEVTKARDGSLYVIGELGFEDYLKGIAEVPRSWPMEALKAQVIAARTYAMTRLRRGSDEGRALGYDLCATTACQVYLGMGIEGGAWGERWVSAVEGTEGQVLLHEGKTADTLYSSTSNGRTYDNEDVFGGAPAPYLRGIEETDDAASPVARWAVKMPLTDLRRFLAANGLWGSAPISSVSMRKQRVILRGGGQRLRLDRESLRDALNDVASCLDEDYPSREPDGYRLPQTVPSRWYRARQEGATIVLEGRGWGHGVGMVQWGAYGKAKRGLDHADILAAYYGGLRPRPAPNPPGTIRVLIADELRRVTVVPEGNATVAGRPAVPAPWTVTGGKRMRLRTGAAPRPALRAAVRSVSVSDEELEALVRLTGDAKLSIEGSSEAARPFEEGRVRFRIALSSLPQGPLRLIADDGVDTIALPLAAPSPEPEASQTTADPSPSASATLGALPSSRGERTGAAWWPYAVAGSFGLVLLLLLLRRPRGLHRSR